MKLRGLVLAAALGVGWLGCGDSGTGGGGAGGSGGAEEGGAGGASSPQAVEDAIDLCYEALQGDVSKRQAGLDALKQATIDYPDAGRGFLFLGMCSLAAAAEDGQVDAFFEVEPALERAIELLPDDHRIPGWLGTVRVQGAIVFNDPVALESAIEEMIAAADLYPEFNNLSLALAFSQLPLDTPYPQMAVDRMEAIRDCGETDERCRDNEAAPHNVPASVMLFGDLYARIGDEATARDYYEQASMQESSSTWPFLADAEAMLEELPSRVAAWTDADPDNDPAFFISGVRTCRGCHE